ncbi:MAG: hypothetical protein AB8B86_00430 [Pseudomonadales bacterium]
MTAAGLSLVLVLVFIGVYSALYFYRNLANSRHWFDVPNLRSSHTVPTPGGAGIAMALVVSPVLIGFVLYWSASPSLLMLFCLAFALACAGWVDDRFGLSRRVRAVLFLGCALLLANQVWLPLWLPLLASALSLFVYTNLFNFMDGTDGLAASQSLFFSLSVAVFAAGADGSLSGIADGFLFGIAEGSLSNIAEGSVSNIAEGSSAHFVAYCLIVSSATAAFLCWNWSPAKVFLGDAGSLFLGFLLAGLAIIAHVNGFVHILVSLVLLIVFVAEALTTIILRLIAREDITAAHRSHPYQLLARRWGSHKKVALSYAVVNCAVVLPLAIYIRANPTEGTIITVIAYMFFCVIIGVLRQRLLLSGADKI